MQVEQPFRELILHMINLDPGVAHGLHHPGAEKAGTG